MEDDVRNLVVSIQGLCPFTLSLTVVSGETSLVQNWVLVLFRLLWHKQVSLYGGSMKDIFLMCVLLCETMTLKT